MIFVLICVAAILCKNKLHGVRGVVTRTFSISQRILAVRVMLHLRLDLYGQDAAVREVDVAME